MAKTLEELMRERPGNPEVQAEHKERMLAEVRAYRLRELRSQGLGVSSHIWPGNPQSVCVLTGFHQFVDVDRLD